MGRIKAGTIVSSYQISPTRNYAPRAKRKSCKQPTGIIVKANAILSINCSKESVVRSRENSETGRSDGASDSASENSNSYPSSVESDTEIKDPYYSSASSLESMALMSLNDSNVQSFNDPSYLHLYWNSCNFIHAALDHVISTVEQAGNKCCRGIMKIEEQYSSLKARKGISTEAYLYGAIYLEGETKYRLHNFLTNLLEISGLDSCWNARLANERNFQFWLMCYSEMDDGVCYTFFSDIGCWFRFADISTHMDKELIDVQSSLVQELHEMKLNTAEFYILAAITVLSRGIESQLPKRMEADQFHDLLMNALTYSIGKRPDGIDIYPKIVSWMEKFSFINGLISSVCDANKVNAHRLRSFQSDPNEDSSQ